MPVNVSQSEVPSLISISKFAVVYAKQMQNRGIQVMNVHCAWSPLLLTWFWTHWRSVRMGNVISIIIRFTVRYSRLNATTGHPD